MRWLLVLVLLCVPAVALATGPYAGRTEAAAACEAGKARPDLVGRNPHCDFQKYSGYDGYTLSALFYGDPNTFVDHYYYTGAACPAGTTWNESTHTCFDSQQCLSKPALGNAFTQGGSGSTCVGGCQFRPDISACVVVNGQSVCSVTGAKPTGQPCTTEPTPKTDPEPKQECLNAAAGQTFCIKPDGQHCYTASTGRQICWQPGETGQKTDGPTMQTRDAGTQPIPPNTQLPSGDTLNTQGSPVTSTTTINNNTTTSTTTITTTTQNYQTQNGTNAGGSGKADAGEKGDGSGKDKGDGDGASGGGNCETPPIVSGDAAMNMVATQAWATRCAVEAGNAAKVTGDVANCATPFSVEGTNANAVKLRAMRAQLCKGDANGDGRPDWTETDGTEAGDGDEGNDTTPGTRSLSFGTDLLDTGGFLGAGGCPSLGTVDLVFTQVNFDSNPYFCTLVQLMRAVLLMIGAFIALRILMGDS